MLRREAVREQRMGREGGFSLVELMTATVMTVIGLIAIMNSCVRLHALQRLDTELGYAYEACRSNLENLRILPLATIATLDGSGFEVPGSDGVTPLLRPVSGDADGLPGEITVRIDRTTGSRILYILETSVTWQGSSGPQSVQLTTLLGGSP